VLAFERGSPFLAAALHAFVSDYLPYPAGLDFAELLAIGVWGAMGPLLLSRVARRAPEQVCALERSAFYPIAPVDAAEAFSPWDEARDAPRMAPLEAGRSFALHFWNALTRDREMACGSLVHRLLERNCIVCVPLPCV
jgi:hypothetical protein